MDMTLSTIVKAMEYKSGLFEHAESMSKQTAGFVYIGNLIYYFIHLPDPFPRGLEVNVKGSSIFPIIMLSMYIDRLGLFIH